MPPWSWLFFATMIIWHIGLSKEEIRVVCYYTNWSVYRPGTAKFNPQNINPYLCTHLIYAFGGFTKENNFKPFDKYQDIEKGGYAKFTGLKTYNKNLKTMLAVGGWNEGSSRFSPLVASPERRKEFIKNSIKFLRQNHFDGLDLDWEYPSFRDGGKPRDKDNYATLVQELREEYDRESEKTGRPRLLLTMAVPAGIEYINKGYDVPKLMKYLDWMNILSYDYHSAFEPAVNHHSPLFPLEEASEYNYDGELNINHTIDHYLQMGAEESKLVLGIPTYGRSYTLFNPDATDLGAPADGPGEMGDATRENGYLAYYEICEKIKDDSWTVESPNRNAMGPYAYKENQWVGYDDEDIVKKKAEFVVERKLGGIMFWSIDNDDFRGSCHGKPYPLIEAAKDALLTASEYNSIKVDNNISPPSKTFQSRQRNRARPNRRENEEKTSTTTERHIPIRKRVRPKVQKEVDNVPTSNKRKIKIKKEEQAVSTTTSSLALTPRYTTPEPPTTPDPGSDFKCEDEGFFPHPRDCKKYFWCLSSGPSELGIVAHQFTCPSGLYFNKAADSCDYTQNVRCVKPKSTTTTSTSTTTTSTTTTTSAPTRRVPPKITAATSRTTVIASSTAKYEEYEYEDEEDDDPEIDSEEDPRVIKELINLIKKAGGIEELEKQLKLHDNGSVSATNPGSTTPPGFSKFLYERVLKSAGGKTAEQPPSVPQSSNSRGPQYSSPRETDTSFRTRTRPQYTPINRQRSTTEKDDAPKEINEPSPAKKAGVPEYMTILRQRPAAAGSQATERSEDNLDERVADHKVVTPATPEYVTLRRARPTTEEIKYVLLQRSSTTNYPEEDISNSSNSTPELINDSVNAVEHNTTNNFEETNTEHSSVTSRRYTSTTIITTEPSTSTAKVSDPIPSKTIMKPRPFQKPDTIYTNRFKTPARLTSTLKNEEVLKNTETDYEDTDGAIKENQLNRQRGSNRFEYPTEHYDDVQKNYQDRKFRPDIASEISDLSSLTSVDFSMSLNGGKRRIVSRQRSSTEVPAVSEPSTFASRQRSTSPVVITNATPKLSSRSPLSRKPFRRLPTESSTSPSTSTTETAVRPSRKIIRRYRPSSTTKTPDQVSISPETKVTIADGVRVTATENFITDDDVFRTIDDEEENIKLSETTIREKSERINSLKDDLIDNKDIFAKFGKSSHLDKATEITENYSPLYRTRKIVRKLNPTTEGTVTDAPNKSRTRKIIRKLGLVTSTQTSDDYDDDVPTTTELEIETTEHSQHDDVKGVTLTMHYDTTTVQEEEFTTVPSTTTTENATEVKLPEKVTPFYYRAKLSRPPFLLQRTRGVTEASTKEYTRSTEYTRKSGFRSRYDRRKSTIETTSSTTTEPTTAVYQADNNSDSVTTTESDNETLRTTTVDVESTPVDATTLHFEEASSSTEVTTDHTRLDATTYTTAATTLQFTTQSNPSTVDQTTYTESVPESTGGILRIHRTSTARTPQSTTQSDPTIFDQTTKYSTDYTESTTRKFRKHRVSTAKPRTALSRNIDSSPKSINTALYKNDRTKTFKNKILNPSRNSPSLSTTESTATDPVTLLHVFAETQPPTTTTTRQSDKVERLIEVNRIVEVSLKEGNLKSNTMLENDVTLIPVIDRVGAISRITNINVVDSLNITNASILHQQGPALAVQIDGKSVVNTFTPKPALSTEASTIALEGLFPFRNEQANDELLETEHARYVNIKILPQDDDLQHFELNQNGTTAPIRILRQDEYTTSKAEVIEISPRFNSGLIKIAPIAITLKNMVQQRLDNITLPDVQLPNK